MEIYVINNKPTVHMSLEEYKDLLALINKYGAENDELRERNNKLTDLHIHSQAVKEAHDEVVELTKLNLELKEVIKKVENERMDLFNFNEDACKKIAELDEENADLRKQVVHYKKENDSLFIVNLDRKVRSNKLEEDNKKLNDLYRSLFKKYSELVSDYSKLKEKFEDIKYILEGE